MSGWNYAQQPPQSVPRTIFDDVEKIQGTVAGYFPIYHIEVHYDTVSMKCHVDENTLEKNFEDMRLEMKKTGYVPLINREHGEYLVHVVKRPPMKFKGPWLNLIMLIATIGTTTMAGAILWNSIFLTSGLGEIENWTNGALYFAFPLMLILSIHEMGHYYAAKKHNVAASLPFFIPMPLSVLGTFGALISIREPIPSKKALMDIGFAGPIAGFVVTIPVLMLGLMLTGDVPQIPAGQVIAGGTAQWGSSIFFETFVMAFGLPNPLTIHPLAFAGWVGLFVTALNLLPAGQLDGGHIARALLGDRSKYAGYGTVSLLLVLGLFFGFDGWLILALIIMFMGIRHTPPLNDVTTLDGKRKMVGIAAALMLVLCFVPVPMSQIDYNYNFAYLEADGTFVGPHFSHSIDKGIFYNDWQNISFPFKIENNGNMPLDLSFEITTESNSNSSYEFHAWLSHNGNNTGNKTVPVEGSFNPQRSGLFRLLWLNNA
jgi:Zn-dependent protease